MDFFDIQEELKKLPDNPGVYLMHNEKDEIIYVGKAISLKNRVRQYFQSNRNKSPKILRMVSNIRWFEYILTDSELEALVLENNLIKEHRPRYNTMLKDDKTYPYIKVTVHEPYPRILFSRDRKKDKARYFGPYTSAESVKNTIDLLHKLFQIRTCHKTLDGTWTGQRPCLNHHLGQCSAPCQGTVSREEYHKQIAQALDFLEGRNYKVVETVLKKRMQEASENMDFEQAAQVRDLLFSVQKIKEKQKINATNQHEDRDIIAIAAEGYDAVVQVFFVRDGQMIGRDHFRLTAGEGDSTSQILNEFVKQFYAGTPYIPAQLLLMEPIPDSEIVEKWLSERRGAKVVCQVPVKGEKARLIALASKNAHLVLAQGREKARREEERTLGACAQIAKLLGLATIHRMEAFDISNISGFESVGSMVVFEDGKSKRSDYRKFRIRSVSGPDDYASMREVLTRRFTHGLEEQSAGSEASMTSFSRFPDLLMMDGGRGQVNIALSVLQELNLAIPVCGMVKDDHHNTRGLYFNNVEIDIDTHSEGFRLITRIQDEAHRFAIEYHRSLRGKSQVHSILDEIEGIGPTRRKALMKNFDSLEAIRNASEEELAAIPGMNKKAADSVYCFFHKENENVKTVE
ncbi:MAG: excinuclease ABC subunit UvrC [Lachnospiraceae bacterium]|nr:excinuclease ABC subunit UvrC [Lachnospiraceae bacterium]